MTALAVMGLLPEGVTHKGESTVIDSISLTGLPAHRLCALRGKLMGMMIQEPMTSLNPVLTVGEQIAEVVLRHEAVSERVAYARALAMMNRVRLPNAARRIHAFPHQLSGGQRQRVTIARALALDPRIPVCDEPVSALDVSIQAQALNLLSDLHKDLGLAYLFISHDESVIRYIADRSALVYRGHIVEEGMSDPVWTAPSHPHTRTFIAAIPGEARLSAATRAPNAAAAEVSAVEEACRFAQACALAFDHYVHEPALLPRSPDHRVACWLNR